MVSWRLLAWWRAWRQLLLLQLLAPCAGQVLLACLARHFLPWQLPASAAASCRTLLLLPHLHLLLLALALLHLLGWWFLPCPCLLLQGVLLPWEAGRSGLLLLPLLAAPCALPGRPSGERSLWLAAVAAPCAHHHLLLLLVPLLLLPLGQHLAAGLHLHPPTPAPCPPWWRS